MRQFTACRQKERQPNEKAAEWKDRIHMERDYAKQAQGSAKRSARSLWVLSGMT
jgi:hypothetical protein